MPFPPTWDYFPGRSKAGAPLTPSPPFAVLNSSPDSCRSLLQGQEWGGKCCEPYGCAIVKSTAAAGAALGLGAGWRRRASVLTAHLAAGRRGPLQGSLGSSNYHPHRLPPHAPLLSLWQMVLRIQGIDKKTVRARKGSSPPHPGRMLSYRGGGPNGSVCRRRESPRVHLPWSGDRSPGFRTESTSCY